MVIFIGIGIRIGALDFLFDAGTLERKMASKSHLIYSLILCYGNQFEMSRRCANNLASTMEYKQLHKFKSKTKENSNEYLNHNQHKAFRMFFLCVWVCDNNSNNNNNNKRKWRIWSGCREYVYLCTFCAMIDFLH